VTVEALRACHGYREDYFDPEAPDPDPKAWEQTSQAVDSAIEKLGKLLRTPPEL
jgi:hypothetical protein